VTDFLLSPAEASRRLAIGDRTLRRLAASGALPKVRLGDRAIRYRSSDIDRLINTGFPGGGPR